MDNLTSILEEEFALAFTVKDEKALRRSLTLLTGSMVNKEEYRSESNTVSTDIKLIAARMEEGFKLMDARMGAMDSRFNRLTGLISLGFLVITVLITLFQFLA
ncbi:MAG: hypothetical protein KAH21_12480 [Spirochaetaceae bacterium]|nr:hypothetical protein [Spirochaetaceae bacterium]